MTTKPCRCGSGKDRHELKDARDIFVAFVCSKCEAVVRKRFRPEIFTDAAYWTDEPVEAGDLYGAPGRDS